MTKFSDNQWDQVWAGANIASMAGAGPYGSIHDAAIAVTGERIAWIGPAAEGRRLEASDPRAAEARYNAALSLDPELVQAQIGLARVALQDGRLEDAQARILGMERHTGFLEPEAVLVLRPAAEKEKVVLFVRPSDPEAADED